MPVPKRKRSKTRRDKRFANKGIKVLTSAVCSNCKAVALPHAVCANCGHYKGVKIMVTKTERGIKRHEVRQAKEQKKKGGQAE